MKHLTMLFCLVLLSSCVRGFDGFFDTKENILLVHSTTFGNDRNRLVPKGTYRTEFRVNRSGKIRLKLRDHGKKTMRVKLDLRDVATLPRQNGTFFVTAQESGQNYDIEGELETRRDNSEVYQRVERCNIRASRPYCYNDCYYDYFGNYRCHTRCTTQTYTIPGYRHVEFYYRNTSKRLSLRFLEPSESKEVAKFEGFDDNSQIIYTYRGACVESRHSYPFPGNWYRPYSLDD